MALNNKTMPPPEMLEQVGPAYASSIRNYLKQVNAGKKVETDWGVYSKIAGMSDEEVSKLDPMTVRDKLSDQEFNRVVTFVRQGREGLERASAGTKKLAETRSTTALIDASAGAYFKDKPEMRAQFGAKVDAWVDEQFAATQKNPTATEKQEYIDRLLIKGDFAKGERVTALRPGEQVDLSAIDMDDLAVPPYVINKIRSQAPTTTEEQVKDVFAAYAIGEQGGVAIAPTWARDMAVRQLTKNGITVSEKNINNLFTKWAGSMGRKR
jgi:hypothetical protein